MKSFILKLELAIIENNQDALTEDKSHPLVPKEYLDLLNAVLSGQYELVLDHPLSQKILKFVASPSECETIVQQIEENVKNFVCCESEDENILRQLVVLIVAISCVQAFVQNNWVGPILRPNLLSPEHSTSQEPHLLDFASNYLSVDGEPIYPLSTNPLLLAVAHAILSNCGCCLTACNTRNLWLMRCLQTQQSLLEDRSSSLKNTICEIVDELQSNDLIQTNQKLAMQFHLEVGHLLYFYYEDTKARQHFDLAKEMSGLKVELKGVLGRRTKYQEKEFSQLVLEVERKDESQQETLFTVDPGMLPKSIPLDDDCILENIKFSESEKVVIAPMTSLDQAVVLGLCHHHRKTHEGQGKIIQEESLAFINCVLSQPRNWCVQTKALILRAQWETETSRQLQRSLSQLEELVTQFNRKDVEGLKRLPLVYTVSLPPKWLTERNLGNMLMSVGATASALEVYLRLQMWEDVIKCYVMLGRKHEAEKLIRNQIAIRESPNLWCYLGDVTDNPKDYLKAWDLSEGRSARSQRCLGFLYIRNNELEKSLPYFEKSLEINPLQMGLWFSYGCTCLRCCVYDKAAKAFQRCVVLNSDNFEAWNNLATAYIWNNDKPRAFLALQEALRCDYENWKIWSNYLLVAVDIGEFEEAIRSYQRLIELRNEKNRNHDVQVLKVLVRAVKEDIPDSNGQPSSRLRSKLLHLFSLITSTIVNDPDVWHLYARLLMTGTKEEISQDDVKNTLKHLLKAYRFYTMDSHWDQDINKCKEICHSFVKLTEEYEECLGRLEDLSQKGQMATSARLTIKSLLLRIEKNYLDPVTNELPKDLAELVQTLENSVKKFLEMSK